MGGHHAASGAAAWVAVTAATPFALGLYPLNPAGVVLGGLVCAGAALLPDADHHSATIAQSLPPLSGIICRGIAKISGGHRHGTHSLLSIGVFTALARLAALVQITLPHVGTLHIGAGIVALLLVSFAVKALRLLRRSTRVGPWLVAATIAGLVTVYAPDSWAWLPLAVGLGTLVHILGDMLTTGGVPLLWPWVPKPPSILARLPLLNQCWRPNGYLGIPILGNAGSLREWLLLIPVSAYAAGVIIYMVITATVSSA